MSNSVKDMARAYARQTYPLFGNIILPKSELLPTTPVEEPSASSLQESKPSWFAQQYMHLNEDWVHASSLETLNQMICNCVKCPLGNTRNKFVFGTGNPNADVVVIGEAPGADEDRQGEPFVGAAGQLLTKILAAINFSRDDVFICNILKSRPPGNRTPEAAEVEQCKPYLYKQLDIIRPRFILAVGRTAANTLLEHNARMGDLRGRVHDYHGINLVVTYHPAALLRNAQWKRPTWEDVQMLRRLYDEWKATVVS